MNKLLNRFQKHSLLAITLLATAALVTPTGAIAGPNCDRHPDHPSCGGGGDGGGGDETSARYTAALTAGGFRFNPVDIAINNRNSGYTSTSPLDLDRPDPETSPPEGQDPWDFGDDQMWDDVFLACYEVLGGVQIDGFVAGTDWGITQGGKKRSNDATNIRITFRNVVADGFPEVDLDIVLATLETYPRADFLPEVGKTSTYPLEMAAIWGDDFANHLSCNSGGFPLLKDAILEISRIE